MKTLAPLLAFALLLQAFAVAQPKSQPTTPKSAASSATKHTDAAPAVLGHWDATLTVERRSGAPFEVDFGIIVERTKTPSVLRAFLVNGSEKTEFTRAQWKNSRLALWIGEYEGELALACETVACDSLTGEYSRLTRMGQMHYKVTARKAIRKTASMTADWTGPSLAGEWDFTMRSRDGKTEKAPARFKQMVAEVEGTIAAVSGDYGVMHGEVHAGSRAPAQTTFYVSRFDGIHTTRIDGVLRPDGSLEGTIAYSPLSTVEFTATRSGKKVEASSTVAREGESLTRMRDASAAFQFAGVDPATGKTVTQADFEGKPMIVDIFGTWCPNCHDEAPLLGEIYKRYHPQGLQIVGLSFEYTDDKARNARVIDFFRKKYNVEYPLLSAGTTDDAEKKLPQLEGFGVFPTTIFIDRKGKVRAVHAGFEGAATGQLEELKKRFEELVKGIMATE